MATPWRPIKQSPVQHELTREGASLTEISGWVLAEHFGNAEDEAQAVRAGVGLGDLSPVPKWELKGTEISACLTSLVGGEIPEPGGAERAGSGTLCRASRHHALLVLDEVAAPRPAALANDASSSGCAHVTERTSGLADFLVAGPKARDLLRKLTSMDLRESRFPNLRCAAGPMAGIQIVLLRRDRGGLPAYEILFTREYGEYLWKVIREAGEEFHLRPCGWAALKLLEP